MVFNLHDPEIDLNTTSDRLLKVVIKNFVFTQFTIFNLKEIAITFSGCTFSNYLRIEASRGTMETKKIIAEKGGMQHYAYNQLTLHQCQLTEKVYINTVDTSRQILIDNCELDALELNSKSRTPMTYFFEVKVSNSVFHEDFALISVSTKTIFIVQFIDCSIENSLLVAGPFLYHRNWEFFVVNFFKKLVMVPRAASIYITNCKFIRGYLGIRGTAMVSLRHSKLSNTSLSCSGVSLQIVDSRINGMNIDQAGIVDIKGCTFIDSPVRITGNYWERSNIVLKNNNFSSLHCQQVSLKIFGSSVGNMNISEAGNVTIRGCTFTGTIVTITRKRCCSHITLQKNKLNNAYLTCKMDSLEIVGF